MRSPFTPPPPEGLDLCSPLLPGPAQLAHSLPVDLSTIEQVPGRGGQSGASVWNGNPVGWPCTRIRLESVAISLGPVPSLTKPPCGWAPGQLAAGRPRFIAREGSASLCLHSFSARLCHLLATATAVTAAATAAAATATAATAAATATAATAATAAATATAVTAAAPVAAHLTAPGAQGTALPATTPRLAPRTPPRTRSSRAS